MKVLKKNGTYEPLDIKKISKSIEWACKGVPKVDPLDIEGKMNIHFFDGITTKEIEEIQLQTIYDMSDLKNPYYDKVYAKLKALKARKEAYDVAFSDNMPSLISVLKSSCGHDNIYSSDLLRKFNEDEIAAIDSMLVHDRDFNFSGAGIDYLVGKYSIYKNGNLMETPQFLYATLSMMLRNTVDDVIKFYNDLSQFKISLPTPAMSNVRTNRFILASCTVITIGDSLDSWEEGSKAIIEHTANDSGVGTDISAVASIGDEVKNGRIVHAGKVPLLKKIEADVNSAIQNKRRGSALSSINFFDPEIITILNIASPRTEVNKRIVGLSYSIKVNKLLLERARQGREITLFSSRKEKLINKLFTSKSYDDFVRNYELAEQDNRGEGTVDARELLQLILEVRQEIGKHYVLFIDNVNNQTPFNEDIIHSQICQEIALPTKPVQSYRRNSADIAICILSNINMGVVPKEELEDVTKRIVYMLNDNVRRQVHPMQQSNAFVEQYMALGIGVSNTAYFLAKQGIRYTSQKALEVIDEYMEYFTYYLIKASMEYARDNNFVPIKFYETSYAKGIMSYERRNKNVDELVQMDLTLDWEWLRGMVLKHGMANTSLSSIPPGETSSVIGGQTNSIYPIKDLVTIKSSSTSVTKLFAPEAYELAGSYDFVYDREEVNTGYLKVAMVIQKWIDQAISLDIFYNPELYENGKVPIKRLLNDLFFLHKHGCKSMYYHNVKTHSDSNKLGCENCSA